MNTNIQQDYLKTDILQDLNVEENWHSARLNEHLRRTVAFNKILALKKTYIKQNLNIEEN